MRSIFTLAAVLTLSACSGASSTPSVPSTPAPDAGMADATPEVGDDVDLPDTGPQDPVDTSEAQTDTPHVLPDDTTALDAGPEDALADHGADAEVDVPDPDRLDARRYCEASVEMFCAYYMRCGRMAAADLSECRSTFLETCNGRYEPLYADLVDRDALALSASGLARCAAHLEDVACEQQIFDLDGCDGMWLGLTAAGGTCGAGIESFVCAPGTTCVLGTNLCGTCAPIAAEGEACGVDRRCPGGWTCTDGLCLRRPIVGEACGEGPPCRVGAFCDAGTCRAPTIVAVGQACDQVHRCPYRSACVGGTCQATALLGQACTQEVGCASGACLMGTCEPLLIAGQQCQSSRDCLSGRCGGGRCEPLTSGCIRQE